VAAEAFDTAGNVATSEATVNVQNSTPLPTTPTNVKATAGSANSVSLNWTASTDSGGPGLSGYYVIRNGVTIGQVNSSTTTYIDSTVSANTAYSYTIEAFDTAGNKSATSAAVSVTTPKPT
jgi:hypothetical protein